MEILKVLQACDWQYFAKGNANILLEYVGSNDFLKSRLLRLRLAKDGSEYILTCELYDFIELKCKPLFPHEIIDIQLVVLDPKFVEKLDTRGHALMVSERYGLVLPNMLLGLFNKLDLSNYLQMYVDKDYCTSNEAMVILEIKPKWLYDNSKNYCRTCSLNQYRGHKRHFCPLDLLYEDTLDQGLTDFFQEVPAKLQADIEKRLPLVHLFKAYLKDPTNVFQTLKQYQRINDKNDLIRNLNSADDVLQTLLLVMTLRDVGLFLRFERFVLEKDDRRQVKRVIEHEGEKYVVSCNIYDLDLKLRMKYKHWYEVEQKLMSIYDLENKDWRFCVLRNFTGDLEH